MANSLVIVESPAKVKTIKKFLGSSYEVDASNGHVRDLPKSQLGIDVEHDYEPKYITIRGKGEILAKLRKEVKKADRIYLATDPDREGEAISWHLSKALKLDELKDKKVYRISFNEITKNAVKASLKAPRDIDMNLVDAQQTRRILDRMVGYSISPDITNTATLRSYMSMFSSLVLLMGIAFEFPSAILLLSMLGIVDRPLLRRGRKYAFVALLIVAAFIKHGAPFGFRRLNAQSHK